MISVRTVKCIENLGKALVDKKKKLQKNCTQKEIRVNKLTYRKSNKKIIIIKNNNQNSPEIMCKKTIQTSVSEVNKELSEYIPKERTQMCKTDIARGPLCTLSSADQNRLSEETNC